jgi:hypothetical protein
MYPARASIGAPARHRGELRAPLRWALLAFLLACVFDPADMVLGAKVWIFVVCWLCLIAEFAASTQRARLPAGLLAYVIAFTMIPLLSIAGYMARDGGEPYGGFVLVKGYVLITFAWLLVLSRSDLFRQLAAILTCLAVVVIVTYLALVAVPDLYLPLYAFGESTGVVQLDSGRDYGSDVVLMQVYFVTSPMLAISIAYYYDKAAHAIHDKDRRIYVVLALINGAGMLLAGSRNNILIGVALPIALWFMYTRHKLRGALGVVVALCALGLFFQNEIGAFLDPVETSNSVKLQAMEDYAVLFENPITLLFGQGLGAYHEFTGRGRLFVTELTYHELVRSFGLFGAILMLGLLLFPVYHAFVVKRHFEGKAVVLGYAGYLVMCASNPLLFSSMGTLILSMILALIYKGDKKLGSRPSP